MGGGFAAGDTGRNIDKIPRATKSDVKNRRAKADAFGLLLTLG